MLRVALLTGLFVVLLWGAAMNEHVELLLMVAGVFAVCWMVDRFGQRER